MPPEPPFSYISNSNFDWVAYMMSLVAALSVSEIFVSESMFGVYYPSICPISAGVYDAMTSSSSL